MSNRETILNHLRQLDKPICDDCISKQVKVEPRNQVNPICRKLRDDGLITRWRGQCNCSELPKYLNAVRNDPDVKVESEPALTGNESKRAKVGGIVHWPLKDLVPVECITSVTVSTSSYDSFGPCHASRLTIMSIGGEFSWGGKTVKGMGPADSIGISLAVRDDSGVAYAPVPHGLQQAVGELFDDLGISYSTLAGQCGNIPDRFPTSPSSCDIKILAASGSAWVVTTTCRPADGCHLPSTVRALLNLLSQAGQAGVI